METAKKRGSVMRAERRLRSAPVLGRSNVQKSTGPENLNARALMETAAPEDGRTPPPSLRHYYFADKPFALGLRLVYYKLAEPAVYKMTLRLVPVGFYRRRSDLIV